MAKVVAVNVSEKKGTIKHAVEEVEMKEDFGIVGDSHAEQGSIRQISLLGIESINKMKEYGIGLCVGKFAENVTTEGICLYELPVGTKLKIGETLHEVTQIGKKCHESRRIDNQLRGRSGRQGDKGSSIFYISLEDDIARIFGGDKLKRITEMMNVDDDMAISNSVISKQIERAQRMVESRNFSIRKSVLSYDDVMNKQREIIYEERNKVLDGVDVHAQVIDMIEPVAREIVGFYYDDEKPVDEWDLEAFNRALEQRLFPEGTAFITAEKAKKLSREGLVEEVAAKAKELLEEKVKYCESVGLDFHDLERFVLLRNVDSKWMDHIDAMSSLREGIGLRGYGQHNPVQEYQKEGFEMFDEMIDNIRRDTAITLMKVTVERSEDGEVKQGVERVNNKAKPVKSAGKVGRNDPCPCGSGKKYKNCCGRNQNN